MTFAISGVKPANGNCLRFTDLVCYDSEDDARKEAENWLHKGFDEVSVWKQIGVPKLETKISWENSNESSS